MKALRQAELAVLSSIMFFGLRYFLNPIMERVVKLRSDEVARHDES